MHDQEAIQQEGIENFEGPQTKIFGPYFNGRQPVYGDPLRIERLLKLRLGNPQQVLDEYNQNENPEAAIAAGERFYDAIRFAFELVPFDPATGQGAGEQACLAVWNTFQRYMRGKENGDAGQATSGQSSDRPACAPSPMTNTSS